MGMFAVMRDQSQILQDLADKLNLKAELSQRKRTQSTANIKKNIRF